MNGRLISVSIALESSHLGLLGRLLEALQRHAVLAQVDAVLLLEVVDQPVDDPLVEVLAAEERVAVGRLAPRRRRRRSRGSRCRRCRRRGRRPRRLPLAFLLEAVGERRGGRLVDDAEDVEAGDPARVLGRLALASLKYAGTVIDRLLDLLAEIVLGDLLHLLQDEGADLGGAVLLAAQLDPASPLSARHDLVRSTRPLSFCGHADRRSAGRSGA